MRPFTVLLWTIVFLCPLTMALAFTPVVVPQIDGNTGYNTLAVFDHEVTTLNDAPTDRVVLIGSSSAMLLGQFEPIVNLSINAAYPSEMALIAKTFCKADDKILFAVTKRDIAHAGKPPRPMVVRNLSTWNRKGNCLKEIVFGFFDRTSSRAIVPLPQAEYDLLVAATGHEFDPVTARRVAGCITEYADGSIDIAALKVLCNQFPNARVVIMPSPSLRPVDSSTTLGGKLNRWAEYQTAFALSIRSSGIPFIDLSTSLGPEYFMDATHVNESGAVLLRDALRTQN